ncbi:hypothetical protein FACS189499_00450 [Clostridia bacterium]|nr:hypothetical protein FACS189499_00450 [Clostridia bacterium]
MISIKKKIFAGLIGILSSLSGIAAAAGNPAIPAAAYESGILKVTDGSFSVNSNSDTIVGGKTTRYIIETSPPETSVWRNIDEVRVDFIMASTDDPDKVKNFYVEAVMGLGGGGGDAWANSTANADVVSLSTNPSDPSVQGFSFGQLYRATFRPNDFMAQNAALLSEDGGVNLIGLKVGNYNKNAVTFDIQFMGLEWDNTAAIPAPVTTAPGVPGGKDGAVTPGPATPAPATPAPATPAPVTPAPTTPAPVTPTPPSNVYYEYYQTPETAAPPVQQVPPLPLLPPSPPAPIVIPISPDAAEQTSATAISLAGNPPAPTVPEDDEDSEEAEDYEELGELDMPEPSGNPDNGGKKEIVTGKNPATGVEIPAVIAGTAAIIAAAALLLRKKHRR